MILLYQCLDIETNSKKIVTKIFENQIYLNKAIFWRECAHDMENWELIVQLLMQHGHDHILFI